MATVTDMKALSPIFEITLPNGANYQMVDWCGRYAIITPEYAKATAYSSGDYVIYQSELYRIDATISAASNTGWAAVTKTKVSVGSELKSIKQTIVNPMHFLGTTTTAISDGSTTNPITIGGVSVTAVSGDIVLYQGKEFIWSGSKWDEFGSTGSLKAFAFADTGSGTVSYTKPTGGGSVTVPNTVDTVTTKYAKIVKKTSGSVATNGSTAAIATLNKTSGTFLTGLGNPSTDTAIKELTVTNTTNFLTGLGSPTTASALTGIGAASYGTLATSSAYGVSALSNHTVSNVTSLGSLPSWSGSVSEGVLSFSWSAGSLPAKTDYTCSEVTRTSFTFATGAITAYTGTGAPTNGVVTAQGTTTSASNFVTGYAATTSAAAVTAVTTKTTGTFVTGYASPASSSALTDVSAKTTAAVPTSYTFTDPVYEFQTSASSSGTYAAENPLPYVSAVSTKSSSATSVSVSTTTGTATVTVTPVTA